MFKYKTTVRHWTFYKQNISSLQYPKNYVVQAVHLLMLLVVKFQYLHVIGE